jgi:hypothetical protein
VPIEEEKWILRGLSSSIIVYVRGLLEPRVMSTGIFVSSTRKSSSDSTRTSLDIAKFRSIELLPA